MDLLKINSDSGFAGKIAIIMMVAIILFCTAWLIIKRLHLKKKYRADEEFVKEYKAKLEEQESKQKEDNNKPETIGENF